MSTQPVTERRAHRRMRALKAVHVRFNNGYGAYEGIARDLSEGGARLRFGDLPDLPSQFEVRIGEGGVSRPAELRWRTARDIGIAFRM